MFKLIKMASIITSTESRSKISESKKKKSAYWIEVKGNVTHFLLFFPSARH